MPGPGVKRIRYKGKRVLANEDTLCLNIIICRRVKKSLVLSSYPNVVEPNAMVSDVSESEYRSN